MGNTRPLLAFLTPYGLGLSFSLQHRDQRMKERAISSQCSASSIFIWPHENAFRLEDSDFTYWFP